MRDRGTTSKTKPEKVPQALRSLFWDYKVGSVAWDKDRDLIIARVLVSGSWEAIAWLRQQVGDRELRVWIEQRRGRGLDARRLRFWELILGLPHRKVNAWLASPEQRVWEGRRSS